MPKPEIATDGATENYQEQAMTSRSILIFVAVILIAVGLIGEVASAAKAPTPSFQSFVPLVYNDGPPCTVLSIVPATKLPATSGTVAQVGPWAGTAVSFGSDPTTPGIYQIHTTSPLGTVTCISCNAPAPGPIPTANKLYPLWDPSDQWIVLVGEINGHRSYDSGTTGTTEMLNGWWMTIYLTTPDGSQWWNLTNYVPPSNGQVIGALDPHFSPDGSRLVWTELVKIPDATHQFGFWQLHRATFASAGAGAPGIVGDTDISPPGGNWFEPEDFSPDGSTILLTSDIGSQSPSYQDGQDIDTYDTTTRLVVNLNNTPYVWDEHGHYSPTMKKISFMSSSPYNSSANPVTLGDLKTEIFLMNLDGSDAQQLTHFNLPGYPEYSSQNSIASESTWSADGTQLTVGQLLTGINYPQVNKWTITFEGSCG